MPNHEYSPADALQLLLDKISKRDPLLVERIKSAIDAGTDIEEHEMTRATGKRRRRVYRKHVAYSGEEALNVAVGVLRAHFLELPQIVNATADAFKSPGVGPGLNARELGSSRIRGAITPEPTQLAGEDKPLAIEVETEAALALTTGNVPPQHLHRYNPVSIEEIARLFESLESLTTFRDR